MSDNRKYYYLKLKENYFDDDSIVLLESMQDGVCLLYTSALLKLFPFFRLYFGKLLVDGLVLVVLFPHLPALGKGSDPALGLDDLSAQVIVTAVHILSLIHIWIFFCEMLYKYQHIFNYNPISTLTNNIILVRC